MPVFVRWEESGEEKKTRKTGIIMSINLINVKHSTILTHFGCLQMQLDGFIKKKHPFVQLHNK